MENTVFVAWGNDPEPALTLKRRRKRGLFIRSPVVRNEGEPGPYTLIVMLLNM